MLPLVGFCGAGIFSSGGTLSCNINLFLLQFAPSEIYTRYDLGVFSPGEDITLAVAVG